MYHFFFSYSNVDKAWAEWIAWTLEENDYKTVLQAWDFPPGCNFVREIDNAIRNSRRLLMVLSENYLQSDFALAEWAAFFKDCPTGVERKLVPVKVGECRPEGLLGPLVFIDLLGLDEKNATEKLIEGVRAGEDPDDHEALPRELGRMLPDGREEPVERSVNQGKPHTIQGRMKPVLKPAFPCPIDPSTPIHFHVPLRRNPCFTGRESILSKLRNVFAAARSAFRMQAVHGLGGVGKTQIALEYVYRFSREYKGIYWIQAETKSSLASSFRSIAALIGMPNLRRLEEEEDDVTRSVKGWFRSNHGWLLVFDNAPDLKSIADYLPSGVGGHVFVTSRYSDWEIPNDHSLSLDPFKREESMEFLSRRMKHVNKEDAGLLADTLDNLPIALEQAAAYCEKTGETIGKYRILFQNNARRLLKQNAPLGYPHPVAVTWEITIEKLKKKAPEAVQWLQLCSFFAPDALPLDDLMDDGTTTSTTRDPWEKWVIDEFPEPLSNALSDRLSFNKACERLKDYSMIDRVLEKQSIHRLVQTIVREKLKDIRNEEGERIGEEKVWARFAAKLIRRQFSINEILNRSGTGHLNLLPHAYAVVEHLVAMNTAHHDEILFLALRHDMEGRANEAKALAEKVRVSPSAPEALKARACNMLAAVYDHLSQYEKALEVIDELLEKINHGLVTKKEGGYIWALYQKGINLIRLKDFGLARKNLRLAMASSDGKSPRAGFIHQLGVIDLELGEYENAQKAFEKCLKIRHPSKSNHRLSFEHRRLGQIQAFRGNWEEAATAFTEAEKIAEACYFSRYVKKIRRDRKVFVEAPRHVLDEGSPVLEKSYLMDRFELSKRDLSATFRVLYGLGRGYVEELEEGDGEPTGLLVPFDKAHRDGVWHGTVAVLFVRNKEFALQKREEKESRGKWDISATGHVDVGEPPWLAAVRETYEELGVLLDRKQLESLESEELYRKIGSRDIPKNAWPDPWRHHYTANKRNREIVWPFLVRCDEKEARLEFEKGRIRQVEWRRLDEWDRGAVGNEGEYASTYWHLLEKGSNFRASVEYLLA